MKNDYKYWDQVAETTALNSNFDEYTAEHYRRAHLDLLDRWVMLGDMRSILKTDLFAEAVCPSRSFLWPILKEGIHITGIDVSEDICRKAGQSAVLYAPDGHYKFVPCDVRKLCFDDNAFDLIISDSTLDHFKQTSDIVVALMELIRVLKPGGTLVITLDNKSNISEPLFRLWILLGLSPFYIGKTYSIKELTTALSSLGMRVEASRAFIHNPRFFAKMMASAIRRLAPGRSAQWNRRLFDYFDTLENKPTRYLTSQFIAVKAVKPAASPVPLPK